MTIRPATNLSTKQISDELDVLTRKWDAMMEDPDFDGHGGSPGEWMQERIEELEAEMKRRQDRGEAA